MYDFELVVFAPHPDDAELFCGGLLAKTALDGFRTAVIDLSAAELSTYGCAQTRTAEASAASEILKLGHRENLGLPNCWISELAGAELENRQTDSAAGRVVEAIRRLRPELVAIPYWQDRHPDHVGASQLMSRALYLAGLRRFGEGKAHVPRQILYYPMRYDFTPSFVLDISAAAEIKYAAISCYRSQLVPPAGEERPTLLSSPLSLRALKARDVYMGSLIGVEHGEGYLSRSALRLDNLVEHFRRSSSRDALYFLGR